MIYFKINDKHVCYFELLWYLMISGSRKFCTVKTNLCWHADLSAIKNPIFSLWPPHWYGIRVRWWHGKSL